MSTAALLTAWAISFALIVGFVRLAQHLTSHTHAPGQSCGWSGCQAPTERAAP